MQQRLFVKFILTGILNTVFGYSIFALLVFLGLHYSLAVFLATVLGILFNFKTFGKLVFNNSDNKLFLKFILVYSIVYLINVSSLKILLNFSVNVYVSGIFSSVIAALFSYKLNKELVFKVRGLKEREYEKAH